MKGHQIDDAMRALARGEHHLAAALTQGTVDLRFLTRPSVANHPELLEQHTNNAMRLLAETARDHVRSYQFMYGG